MNLVRQHCHGYVTGCLCPNCEARSIGVHAGLLYYDKRGQLRYKDRPQLMNAQALAAFMRDRKRKTLSRAA